MVSGSGWDEEKRYQQLVRDLYEWAGAATAAREDPQTVAEIKQIKQLRRQIHCFTGDYTDSSRRDPVLDEADDLLNKFHLPRRSRQGYRHPQRGS